MRPLRRLFEDFVPISETEALITTGAALDTLDRVEIVRYQLDDEGYVRMGGSRAVLAKGPGVRLGGFFDGQLIYSTRNDGVIREGVQVERWDGWVIPKSAHQPFVHEGSLYYTDEWPYVKIHQDGKLFLDHFGPMVQVSNPCWVGDVMYFECRDTVAPNRPDAWQIWSKDRSCSCPPRFVAQGANPAQFGGRLFWGEWNGRTFSYRSAVL